MKHTLFTTLSVSLLNVLPFIAEAQTYTGIQDATPFQINLEGSTRYNGWYNFASQIPQTKVIHGTEHTFPGVPPGYPTALNPSGAYPNPIQSNLHSHSSMNFNKVANGNGTGGLDQFNTDGTRNGDTWRGTSFGPVPSGGSLYAISFSNVFNAKGGTLGVFAPDAIANLSNVVFQVQIGSANGYDFYEKSVVSNGDTPWGTADQRPLGVFDTLDFQDWAPTLNLTFLGGGTLSVVADYGALFTQGFNGTIPMPTGPDGELVEEPIWVNLYGFQWDLSTYTDIVSYNITFDVVEHSQLYAVQLDQSDSFTGNILGNYVIPEPGTYAAIFWGIGLVFLLIRRRKSLK